MPLFSPFSRKALFPEMGQAMCKTVVIYVGIMVILIGVVLTFVVQSVYFVEREPRGSVHLPPDSNHGMFEAEPTRQTPDETLRPAAELLQDWQHTKGVTINVTDVS